MKLKPGIHVRLALLGALPTGLLGLALAAFFIQTRITDLNQDLLTRSDLLLSSLASAAVSPIKSKDYEALQQLAESALKQKDVVEVSISGREGISVFRKNTLGEGESEYSPRLSRNSVVFYRPSFMEGQSEAVDPSTHPDAAWPMPEAIGLVRLDLSRQSTLKRQYDTIGISLLLLLGGIGLTFLLSRRLVRKISEPVLALTMAVHEMSKGNMDVRAESEAEAELAYLQAGFNAMAAELKKNRDSLEDQVQLATIRLREALEALEKRNRELEAARWLAEAQTELKSRFLAQMSHEIRTPMSGILGFSEMLAKTPLNGDQADKLGLITRSAKDLLTIINDILDLTKLEVGKISLEVKSFALRACLEDIVCLLSGRGPSPSIALWIDPAVPLAIRGDPVRIQQVIANLLGNALKFTERGRIVIRVRCFSNSRGERLLFSVSDSGRGIPPADMAKLFSPFSQLGEHSFSSEKGTGLGLSIAKNIVKSMGGKIQIASRLGKGTSLWFDLPLEKADWEKPTLALRETIGLIEQDRLFRRALAVQLESLGFKVEAFANFDEFFKHYKIEDYPKALLYGFWPKRERADAALPGWLEWCEIRGTKVVLLFPSGERRMVAYYRKRGTMCLFHPARSETLVKAIGAFDIPTELPLPEVLPTRKESHKPMASYSGLKILIADDNEINRLLLREQLKGVQGEIIDVGDGKEALERLLHQRFDFVFLDIQMPIMDGRQVLLGLRDKPGPNRFAPVIAITAYASPKQRDACLQLGFDDCLIKPVVEDQLLSLIAKHRGGEAERIARLEHEATNSSKGYASAILGKTGGDREFASVIARKLFLEFSESLRTAESTLRNRESEAARYIIHKINGSAGFAGLVAIRQAALVLESALVQGESWEFLEELFRELKQEIEAFLMMEDMILAQFAQEMNLASALDALPALSRA